MNQYDQLSLLCATVGTFKKAATVASKLIFNDSRLLQCKPDRVICILPYIQHHIKIWIILTKNLGDEDVRSDDEACTGDIHPTQVKHCY